MLCFTGSRRSQAAAQHTGKTQYVEPESMCMSKDGNSVYD